MYSPDFTTSRTSEKIADDDRILVNRFKAGDEDAFSEIMNRYKDKIHSICYGYMLNHGDSEELTQDVFVKAYRGLNDFRGDCSLSTWLHRIAMNLSLNRYWYFSRRKRRHSVSLDYPVGGGDAATFSDLLADEGNDARRNLELAEYTAMIERCVDMLPEHYREILIMRMVQKYPYEKIGSLLQLNTGTVKSRIARSRSTLRSYLDQVAGQEYSSRDLLSSITEHKRGRLRAVTN